MRKYIAAATAGLAIICLAGCAPASKPQPPRFATALKHCHVAKTKEGVTYADGGKSLILETDEEDDDSSVIDIDKVMCIVKATKASSAVLGEMGQTREIDGMQHDKWAGIKASWTYASGTGFDLTMLDTRLGKKTGRS